MAALLGGVLKHRGISKRIEFATQKIPRGILVSIGGPVAIAMLNDISVRVIFPTPDRPLRVAGFGQAAQDIVGAIG